MNMTSVGVTSEHDWIPCSSNAVLLRYLFGPIDIFGRFTMIYDILTLMT